MAAKRCKKHKYQISVLVISMCYNEHKSKFCLPADYSTVCFKIDIAQGNQYSTFDVGCSMFDVQCLRSAYGGFTFPARRSLIRKIMVPVRSTHINDRGR